MIKRLIELILAVFLLSGFSPRQNLIEKSANNETLTNETLANVAKSTYQKSNQKIVFIDGETARQLDECYILAKNYSSFNNPVSSVINDFFLPERLSSLTPLEIIDIPLTFAMFGAVATKAPKIISKANKLTKSEYLNLGATDLMNKAVYGTTHPIFKKVSSVVVKKISQAEEYGTLLFRHVKLRREIELLEKAEWLAIQSGKKARHILTQIEKKLVELSKTEKSLNKLLSEWIS